MALLRLVTISGADDQVDPDELWKLSDDFPFVEWGLLYSSKRAGTPRYPSIDWLTRFAVDTMSEAKQLRCSVHLCGAAARVVVESGKSPLVLCHYPRGPSPRLRVQINGLRTEDALLPHLKPWIRDWRELGVEVILQIPADTVLPLSAFSKASFLFDSSGGRGIPITTVPSINEELAPVSGLAGGLKPETIFAFLEAHRHARGFDFSWIDMETGARNENDEFDLERVRSFLDQCSNYIEPR